MNKHNIVEIFDYKKNRQAIKNQHQCFEFLDSLKDRVEMSKTYAINLKLYLKTMVRDGHIEESFASNLRMQVDFIMDSASVEIPRRMEIK